jgi:hypothetical protein
LDINEENLRRRRDIYFNTSLQGFETETMLTPPVNLPKW